MLGLLWKVEKRRTLRDRMNAGPLCLRREILSKKLLVDFMEIGLGGELGLERTACFLRRRGLVPLADREVRMDILDSLDSRSPVGEAGADEEEKMFDIRFLNELRVDVEDVLNCVLIVNCGDGQSTSRSSIYAMMGDIRGVLFIKTGIKNYFSKLQETMRASSECVKFSVRGDKAKILVDRGRSLCLKMANGCGIRSDDWSIGRTVWGKCRIRVRRDIPGVCRKCRRKR